MKEVWASRRSAVACSQAPLRFGPADAFGPSRPLTQERGNCC
jgi:hypothetical protein